MPDGTNDGYPTLAGQMLADRYRLDAPIDGAGTGEMWSARDTVLNRPVAVRLINQEHAQDEESVSRFRAESRSAAALSHSGVAKVFDYGEHDSTALPCQYLVMEHVSGRPLTELLAQGDPLPADLVLDITAQAARALQAAHDIGIMHRNVSPANLLVTDDGWVKLTDFGVGPADSGPQPATVAGAGIGRADAYLSPEQAEGQPASPASDIYSLGVIAYECLSGRLPFSEHAAGRAPQAPAGAGAAGEPRPLPDQIPAGVREMVSRMIASDPWLRPGTALAVAATATALREDLLAADLPQPAGPQRPQPGDGEPDAVTTTAPQPVIPANRAGTARRRRRRGVAAVAVAVGMTALCGAIAAMMSSGKPPPPPSKPPGSTGPGVQGMVPAIGPTVHPGKAHRKQPVAPASGIGTAPPARASAPAPTPRHHPSAPASKSSSPSPAPTHSSPAPSPTSPPPTSPSPGPSSGTGAATP